MIEKDNGLGLALSKRGHILIAFYADEKAGRRNEGRTPALTRHPYFDILEPGKDRFLAFDIPRTDRGRILY